MNRRLEVYVKTKLNLDEEIKRVKYLEEELEDLNIKRPIRDGEVSINTTHIQEEQVNTKIGFFIRNATNETIILKQIPVKFIAKEGYILDMRRYKLKVPLEIPSYSAMPCSIDVDKKSYPKFTYRVVVDSRVGGNR
ncbi:SLAP domain-containing protein [Anaerosalibacter massiliensis]|uniref:SLAP domain-containing protein n=1 Tax=Anaerosalibacter massiliensis TaxID=1347392 RepID=A0A9X2MGA5_9FIRM|nr:SLAP domain-containing protein [Anaerosalibacter massiliensis]MCR2044512.1 SLAP domain-containing protein [Anaerosalibacter massiliensis]